MILPSLSTLLGRVRQAGAWVLAPFRTREDPEPLRTRVGRRAPWFAGVAAVLVLLFGSDPPSGGPELGPFGLPSLVLGLLAWRPLIGWRIAWVTTALWLLLMSWGGAESLMTVSLVVAVVVVMARHRREVGWSTFAWTTVLLLATGQRDGPTALLLVVVLGLSAVAVDARRQRAHATAEVVSERSARIEREAESLVLEERARIARELHDVVAHHMSMVAVQAETAPYRLGQVHEPVRDEFTSIARAARTALNDVRGILTVLRDDHVESEHAPQPSLDGLEPLVALARGAGGVVELDVVGERRPLPTALELGAYRIIQESLANAARHARGAVVRVVVAYRAGELAVTVTNGPPAEAVPVPASDDGAHRNGGHGLVGMRERAHLLRGRLSAGPTADGGFEVAAVLPTEDDDVAGDA